MMRRTLGLAVAMACLDPAWAQSPPAASDAASPSAAGLQVPSVVVTGRTETLSGSAVKGGLSVRARSPCCW